MVSQALISEEEGNIGISAQERAICKPLVRQGTSVRPEVRRGYRDILLRVHLVPNWYPTRFAVLVGIRGDFCTKIESL